jgi:hypothetical protein
MPRTNIASLVGETLTHIDCDGTSQIMLTTASGRQIMIYHEQDCCESVQIQDTEGNWHDLIGKVITDTDHDTTHTCGDCADSCTLSVLTFKVDDATVISRWIGESNGYYSEGVDLLDITKRN